MYTVKNNITGNEVKSRTPERVYGELKKELKAAGLEVPDFDTFIDFMKRSGRIKIGLGRLSIVVTWDSSKNKRGTKKSLEGQNLRPKAEMSRKSGLEKSGRKAGTKKRG